MCLRRLRMRWIGPCAPPSLATRPTHLVRLLYPPPPLPPPSFSSSSWFSFSSSSLLSFFFFLFRVSVLFLFLYLSSFHFFSASTALTSSPLAAIPIHSVYKYLVERNPCNHRDFQVPLHFRPIFVFSIFLRSFLSESK